MEQKFHYATVTEAIENLRTQGFVLDFNLKENMIKVGEQEYSADEFEIVDLYRYEGDSDPGDEATVYAISSPSGLKGILVSGYGASIAPEAADTLQKLHYRYQMNKK